LEKLKHYIRFGSHAEAKVLKEVKSHIRGLTFNANIVAHRPVAIYRLLFINFPAVDYFVDPQTYIFQLDPIKYYSNKKGKIKNSVLQLAKSYGEPFTNCCSLKPISPDEFLNSNIDSITKSVIEFQLNYINDEFNKIKTYEGYDDYENDNSNSSVLNPEFVIPPSFYLNIDKASFSKWLNLNESCIKSARVQFPDRIIVPELILDKRLLNNNEYLNDIIEKYNNLGLKRILIWIDDFDETEEDQINLGSLVSFYKRLDIGKISLFGGGFSLLLFYKKLLDGFCHGPGYGESRGIKPVGGGRPTAKYYLPYLMNRLDYTVCERILQTKNDLNSTYFKNVCNCKICKKNLTPPSQSTFFTTYGLTQLSSTGKSEIPVPTSLFNSHVHFLEHRFYEINEMTFDRLIKMFEEFIQWNESHSLISTEHLSSWIKILK
jgi:hypothetical protein